MRDLVRDWRRWTKAERIAASTIVTVIVVGVPVFALGV
jgi:hypothetical protein